MMVKTFPLLLFFLNAITLAWGQADKDVKVKEVPEQVKVYISKNYPDAQNVRYYKELEKDEVFYEVSFTYKKDTYNLLLYPDGRLYETEIVIKFEELPPPTRESIGKDLKQRYDKYRIRLVEEVNPQAELKYEIKVKAKKGHHSGFYEVFYDREGKFLQEEEETLTSIPSNSGF